MGEPHAAADRRAASHGDAAEDGGAGIDHDVVLDDGMAQPPLDQRARLVGGEAARAERHGLVQAHSLADHAGLADDDAGTVVDEEAAADLRPGMDIDAGERMGDLADGAREEPGAELVQRVRQPMVDDRRHSGIDQQDLGVAGRGGIAGIGGAEVAYQQAADIRQGGGELGGDAARSA